ncbi:C-Myc-binding protein homolog [Durio zibethinus]|uniref:c-Myc-binding protein homolog n=1 Tax=Durio zibethinus TaxID=66656 RepID=A0A6P5WX17_DURZI|nr:C-Myc-binding protein homolog [Durio zibethinus]
MLSTDYSPLEGTPTKTNNQGLKAKKERQLLKIMMRYNEEKEAKKEAFRKYLESSGVLDALTKVLVALYEQNEKPSSALEFVQQKLGGPTASEYEKLQAEISDLQTKYNELLGKHENTCKELEELKNLHSLPSTKETINGEAPKDEV